MFRPYLIIYIAHLFSFLFGVAVFTKLLGLYHRLAAMGAQGNYRNIVGGNAHSICEEFFSRVHAISNNVYATCNTCTANPSGQ